MRSAARRLRPWAWAAWVGGLAFGAACGGEAGPDPMGALDGGPGDQGPRDQGSVDIFALPFAREVVRFDPGPGAGFGAGDFPQVVLGPPVGRGPQSASLDVLSLGVGGQIVLGFGPDDLVDGPGVDLVVFENPFWVGGDPQEVFAELGQVAVSADGVNWTSFPCSPADEGPPFPGCAGWTPTEDFVPEELLDPAISGGDGFDLADLGLDRVRFVRITDLSPEGDPPTAGFDLDAVGGVYLTPTDGSD